jgi:hypothetical protein
VVRDGNWYSNAFFCRVAARLGNYSPANRENRLGFRSVLPTGP